MHAFCRTYLPDWPNHRPWIWGSQSLKVGITVGVWTNQLHTNAVPTSDHVNVSALVAQPVGSPSVSRDAGP